MSIAFSFRCLKCYFFALLCLLATFHDTFVNKLELGVQVHLFKMERRQSGCHVVVVTSDKKADALAVFVACHLINSLREHDKLHTAKRHPQRKPIRVAPESLSSRGFSSLGVREASLQCSNGHTEDTSSQRRTRQGHAS